MRSLILAALMICAFSCTLVEIQPPVEGDSFAEKVYVRFCAESSAITRSSIDPDENRIEDLNVYAFRDGVLEDAAFVSGDNVMTLNLYAGYSYNIYAAANMGHLEACVDEGEFIENFSFYIAELSDLAEVFPMFCCYRDMYIGGGSPTISLDMERLVSKLSLSIDKAALLEGLQVSSVRLCQCPSVVRPFKWYGKGGSRAETIDDVIDGDFATSDDLISLNQGECVLFYTLENCQGILLPDNDDPLMKIPQMVGENENLCTYLELSCVFGPEGMLDGEVDYRIYLGLDSVSSFDLPGNACVNVILRLTGTGLREVSWKVDADISVRDGYASGRVAEGMHSVNDLYVGESVLYEVELAAELMEYLGGDASGCSLAFLQNGVVSDKLLVDNIQVEDNVLWCELHCRAPVLSKDAGKLYLYSSNGECIGCLENKVVVKTPKMIFAEYGAWLDSDPVELLTCIPEMEINGTPAMLYIYFVDENGYNLNGSCSYRFDNSLFEYDVICGSYGGSVVNGISVKYDVLGSDIPGGAAAELYIYCKNDGTDHTKNQLLAEIYSSYKSVLVEICEMRFDISRCVSVGCLIPQVCLTLVDNGWAKYHDCQLSVIVENPSNLPLDVCVWQLITTHLNYDYVDAGYVEKNLTLEPIQYITGQFYNGVPPIYGSFASFCSERNSYGVYPLVGIATTDIRSAVNYDKRGNGQMIHLIDAAVVNHKIRSNDLIFNDNVCGGLTEYEYIYKAEEAWNYRGTILSSNGSLYMDHKTWSYDYPSISAYSLNSMYDRFSRDGAMGLLMNYNSDYEKVALSAQTNGSLREDMTISIGYSGVVNGYVQTYPNGTWYASQDNYCSVDVDATLSGVSLPSGGSQEFADDGILKKAVSEIYEFSYKDSPRPLGSNSYLHRAHPTDFDLSVSCLVEGDYGNELYPIYVDWKFDGFDYYHEQDGMNYKCALSVDNELFNIVVVRNKNS